jgi:voltage-gated potassium channel
MILSYGLHYATVVGAVVFFSLTGLALLFERDAAGANIHTYGDAIWWGIATITTVGYGDRFPVTTEGRAISIFIMILGISLFSLITASIAAKFVRPSVEREEATLEDVLARLEQMEARLIAMQHAHDDDEPVAITRPASPLAETTEE